MVEGINEKIVLQAMKLYQANQERVNETKGNWGVRNIPYYDADVEDEYFELIKLCQDKEEVEELMRNCNSDFSPGDLDFGKERE